MADPEFHEEGDGAYFSRDDAEQAALAYRAQGRLTRIEENLLTFMFTIYAERV